MADSPVDLDARRAQREDYDGALCRCGNAWFHTQVVLGQDDTVTGYNWPPICTDCGRPLQNTRRRS